MPCLLAVIVLMFPRVILALMWLLTNYIGRAYDNILIPVLGFFFLPITTIAYAWMVNNHMRIEGVNVVILVVAVLFDAASHDSGRRSYRGRA